MLKFIILFPLKCLWAGFKLSMLVLVGLGLAGIIITFFPFVLPIVFSTGGLIGIVIGLIWWMDKKSEELKKYEEEIKKEDEGK